MRRSISGLILLLLAASAWAQAFGRFGFVDQADVPGFEIDRTGFRVRHERADRFIFEEASKVWKPLLTSELSQTIGLGGVGRSPAKARFDLAAPGISLYFQNGIGFRLTTTSAPFLTWKEGSVGPGVPTPSLKWVLISFRDDQPPVFLSLQGEASAFQISGKPGDWRLRTAGLYRGWARVAAPLGRNSMATNTAASLGGLKAKVLPLVPYFADEPPKLVKVEFAEDPTSVTATWTFDRPYAAVPIPAILANLGGYALKLDSETIRLDSSDPDGPVSVLLQNTMRIRFPVRRMPTGRSLALGAPAIEPIGTASPIDIATVAELALANLPACRDQLTKETAEETLAKYLTDATYATEPHTNQRLPYSANGAGLDLASAHALLMQSTITTVKATSEPNALLTSVMWRRDWRTWRLWTPDAAVSRRAGALAALAAALCPEPARRLDAAMLEAGLAGEAGLQVWRERYGLKGAVKPSEPPLEGVRRAMFLYPGRKPADEAYVLSLMSEIRVYGDLGFRAVPKEGGLALVWPVETARPFSIMLASAYPLAVSPVKNLASAVGEEALGFTVVRCVPTAPGPCELLIKVPEWAGPLPSYAEAPRFVGNMPAPLAVWMGKAR